ncbi:MAG: leucine-rich repeat protein, partial [Lachnospiraceae bacterium]|nr:leucine-rich repeat protein [Lachnospiraceae bacterium]
MKRKRLLAAVMAAVMASTLTMGMPVTGYAMDQGTETVANEPEGSNSSDTAVTNPELDADSVPESTDEKSTAEESDAVSESQEMKPDSASVAESTEAEGGAVAAPDAQNNTVGVAEDSEAVSEIKKFADFNYVEERGGFFPGIYISSYTGIEASITIPDAIDGKTVVGIRGRAFDGCTSLQQVTFSKNLTHIGEEAFWGCSSLKKIVFLGDDATNIGEYAFGRCTALQDITLPDYITIENGAFYECKALTQITLPDSVYLGTGAFSGTSLKEITIPDIGCDLRETFTNCKSLQKVTILGGVDTRNRTLNCTFSGCTSLQEVSIFDNNITAITNATFEGCTSLQQITIPDSVTNIDGNVFEGCTSLKEITIPNSVKSIGYYTFKDCTSLQQITIPNSVTSIGGDAFEGCTSLKEIAIPNSVTSIGWGAFKDCTLLQKAIIPESVNGIGRDAFQNCTSLTEITIPGGVTSIEWGTFSGCSLLQQITIPDGVTSIGGNAFYNCTALQRITIPSSVTSIEGSTFSGCKALQQITIPNSVTSIEGGTFCGCEALQQITIPNSVTSIGFQAFGCCKALQEITIPGGVTSIGDRAFSACSSLKEITIPSGVTSIGKEVFEGCEALQRITIPDGVTSIGEDAFSECSSLIQITIPGGVTSIGEDAFSGCSSLKEIAIPSGVTSLGGGAFSGCSSLKEITIPSGVTSIEHGTFYGCKALQQITIPDSVTSIGVEAFYGCSLLKEITVPSGVTSIGLHTFGGCGCKKIVILGNIVSIGDDAFYTSALKEIYFYGDAPANVKYLGIPSAATIYVLKGKSGWTVPTWNGYKTAYFTPESKPASTPTPVPTATPTPVPTQEASDIDTTKYDPDYTQTFEDFMTGTGTMYSVKWLTKNENFPHFSFVYEHDQKIGTYITATITNVLYRNNRDNIDGLKEMFSSSVSKDYAKQVLLAFMEQKSEENKTLVKAREAQNTAKKIADGFDKFIKRNDFAIPPEDRKHLELFFHSDTIDKKLQEGKYQDLVLMCHLNGYKDSSAVVKALKAYQKASEFSKILTGTLGITGTVLDLKEDYDTLVQQIYNYKVTSETNQIYIELLEYIRDNVKYEVVKDAAEDILNVLNTETDDQWKKITAAFLTEKGEKVVTSKVIGALEEAVKKLPYGEIIERAYKWSKGECNKVFGTANYEEQYDNMRVLAYLGDAIGQWTLKNYVSYFKTDDITQKNTFARKSYYGLRLLLKTREDGEEALQGLWTGKGTDDFKNSQLYRVSVEVSGALKKKESLLFTADRDKAFYATAAACPVDVEVYNAAGEKALTIKNGQEIPFTTSGDILYTEYQNPGSGDYDKIVILPKDAGYTLKYVGTGLGTMILHTMDANTEMTTEKYLQNIPITSSTVVEMKDSSGNSGNLTLTTGKDSQKTTMKLRPLESTYVPVASLTFPAGNLKLKEGESALATVKVEPENATDQSITWTSASDSIATVSADGVVTGKSAGTTTLTASAEDDKVTKKLTITVTKKENSGKSQESRSMYRLYNPNSGEHFYTSNQGERDHLVSLGWRYEGVAWNAPLTGAPIFRLYNPNAGDHHYTGSEKERDDLVKLGWKYEGVAWYTAPST